MNREMFNLYDFLKESKMLPKGILCDHRNVITDGKQFGASIAWRSSGHSTLAVNYYELV